MLWRATDNWHSQPFEMNSQYCRLVRHQYENSGADSTGLFRTILSVAEEVGLDDALECLQQCVIEKKAVVV